MKPQVKKLISYLKSTKKVSCINVYKGKKDCYFEYYFYVTGIFKQEYFALCLNKTKTGIVCNKITHTTDCSDQMKALFLKYLK
jgi:hypothetical protein